MKKRLAIAGTAAAVALLLFLPALRNAYEPVHRGGVNSPYPYSWTQKRSGAVQIELSSGGLQGYAWSVENWSESTLMVTSSGSSGAKTRFMVTPVQEGMGTLSFLLAREGKFPDEACRILFYLYVEPSHGKPRIVSGSGEQNLLSPLSRGGKQVPCLWYTDEEGSLNFIVEDDTEDWDVVLPNDAEGLWAYGPYPDEGTMRFVLRREEAGTAEILIHSGERGVEYRLRCAADKTGALSLSGVTERAYTAPPEEAVAENRNPNLEGGETPDEAGLEDWEPYFEEPDAGGMADEQP